MRLLYVSVDINPGKAGGKLNRASFAVCSHALLTSSEPVGMNRHRLRFIAKPRELQVIRTTLRSWNIGVHHINCIRPSIAPAKA